jgi:hypothetical protein
MKSSWSADTNKIIAEIKDLAESEIPLVLAKPGAESMAITVRHVLAEAGLVLVEVSKPPAVVLDEAEPYYVFYQRDQQPLMRGFSLHFSRQSEKFARAPLPEEIFEIQRRKFLRVFTPPQSTLTCVPKNSRRLFTAQILDVSLEGAKIFGNLEGVSKGSVLSPLTLTLYFREKRRAPVTINIAEAVVVREVRVEEKVEVSFQFSQTDTDHQLLENYIDHRSQELDLF